MNATKNNECNVGIRGYRPSLIFSSFSVPRTAISLKYMSTKVNQEKHTI